jgi:anti-sigma regulatory factor (Ser/Thr protein kinase)
MESTSIRFHGSYQSLEELSQFIEENARRVGFDENKLYAIETAVDEAFSNIIDHAYGDQNIGDIDCTCLVQSDRLTVVLHDHGHPFDPDSIPEPEISCCLEDRKEHGLGLFIIKKLMDDVQFEFSADKGNTLTMTKFKDPAA